MQRGSGEGEECFTTTQALIFTWYTTDLFFGQGESFSLPLQFAGAGGDRLFRVLGTQYHWR